MTARRFLNYPLKEKKPLLPYCSNLDLSAQILEAGAEWQARKTWKKKQAERKAREEAKRGQLWAHLDQQSYKITGIYGVVEDTLKFYKGNPDAPHPQYQVKSAELYAYHKSIWTIDNIITRYIPKTMLEDHMLKLKTDSLLSAFNLEI